MTPVSYKDASEILGKSLEAVKRAVSRDVLTRLPRAGLYQYLIKEQVLLFKGKLLSLSALSQDERQQWAELARQVIGQSAPAASRQDAAVSPTPQTTPPVNVSLDADTLVKAIRSNKLKVTIEAPDIPLTPAVENAYVFVLILLGLMWLFAEHTRLKQAAADAAEQTITQLGMDKDRLAVNQVVYIDTLKNHPDKAAELKQLLIKENYPLLAA